MRALQVSDDQPAEERRRWLGVLARATEDAVRALLPTAPTLPSYRVLRGPELGMVMVRGRIGGDGAPFNLGEMTVVRCTVQCGDTLGHAIVAGRNVRHAELAAHLDAALQQPALAGALQRAVIAPLALAEARQRERESRQAAATRVDFATLATMRG